jgi:hypothetical protein
VRGGHVLRVWRDVCVVVSVWVVLSGVVEHVDDVFIGRVVLSRRVVIGVSVSWRVLLFERVYVIDVCSGHVLRARIDDVQRVRDERIVLSRGVVVSAAVSRRLVLRVVERVVCVSVWVVLRRRFHFCCWLFACRLLLSRRVEHREGMQRGILLSELVCTGVVSSWSVLCVERFDCGERQLQRWLLVRRRRSQSVWFIAFE